MPTVEYAKNGSFFCLKGTPRENTPTKTTRGTIKTFSKQSQKRLRFAIAKIDRSKVNNTLLFITLTYPSVCPGFPSIWKRHLHNFNKALVRFIPDAAMIWKLEFQSNGNPHYHLLVFPPQGWRWNGRTRELYKWVAETWNRIAAPGDKDHLAAGTRTDVVNDPWPFLNYIGKYLSDGLKQARTKFKLDSLGRFYGIYNRLKLPITMIETTLDQTAFVQLRRICYKLLSKKTGSPYTIFRDNQGITLFLNSEMGYKLVYFICQEKYIRDHKFCEYFRTRFDPRRFPK